MKWKTNVLLSITLYIIKSWILEIFVKIGPAIADIRPLRYASALLFLLEVVECQYPINSLKSWKKCWAYCFKRVLALWCNQQTTDCNWHYWVLRDISDLRAGIIVLRPETSLTGIMENLNRVKSVEGCLPFSAYDQFICTAPWLLPC